MEPRRSDDGFTLPEILVVTVVLMILAAIAIVTFVNQRQSAHRGAAITTLRNVQLHAETLRADDAGAAYTGDLDAYRSIGGGHSFVAGDVPSTASGTVSVAASGDGGQVAFAARGGDSCYYLRLEVDADDRITRSAEVGAGADCRADEFTSGAGSGW